MNPHVAPFISTGGFGNAASKTYYKNLDYIRGLLGTELSHWVRQFEEFVPLPGPLKAAADAFLQNYSGDVTIAPKVTLRDYLGLLSDVPEADYPRLLHHSYILCLERMSYIRSLYGIEREFDRYYNRLKY